MNVRKPVDYGAMYRELSVILAQNLPQMDEIYAIGKTISQRRRKVRRSWPQNFCRRISLTAQAFPRAMCARYAIFTRLMKMAKNSYGRSS